MEATTRWPTDSNALRSTARLAEKMPRRSAAWASSDQAATAAACTKSGEAVPVAVRNFLRAPMAAASPTIAPER